MILVTGAAGFIGSSFVWQLNQEGIKNIILCDKLRNEDKWKNIAKREYYDWIDRDELFDWLSEEHNAKQIKVIVHMGAISATTETDGDLLMKNNYEFTKKLWDFATDRSIQFIYASSAATYGMGENGYEDNIDLDKHEELRPLNKYGYSKKIFDVWALKQEEQPKQWVGLKFFNVYGPQEYHKGRMASMVFHSYNQGEKNGYVNLFKSHKEGYKDGEQLRDFVYIKDIVSIISWFIKNPKVSGIFNLGTGKARSFYDLTFNTLKSSGLVPDIRFVDMPEDLRGKYQYFTEANMDKLKEVGYKEEFTTLEEGIKDYVENYLSKEDKYL